MSHKVELSIRQLICVEQALEGRIEECEKRIAKCNELGMSLTDTWEERLNAAKSVLDIVKNS
tara:strand:- start:654 stop:839 length:186 start_codon:yes stop_codon:yes gene_type:complete